MDQIEMKRRTKEFAKEIIILCRKLPNNREGRLIGKISNFTDSPSLFAPHKPSGSQRCEDRVFSSGWPGAFPRFSG